MATSNIAASESSSKSLKTHKRRKLKSEPARKPVDQKAANTPTFEVHREPLNQIVVKKGRRKVDPLVVEELREAILEEGFRAPITIRIVGDEKHLVVGLHRLEAARAAGLNEVPCYHFKGGSIKARLWEIDENLLRNELTVLEESNQIVERLKLVEQLNAVKEEKEDKKSGRPKGGTADQARKMPGPGTEQAKRARIQRAKLIAVIEPDLQNAIVAANLDDNQFKLLAIAKQNNEKARREKFRQLTSSHQPSKTRSDSPEDEQEYEALRCAWKKAARVVEAWDSAGQNARARFVKKVLRYSNE